MQPPDEGDTPAAAGSAACCWGRAAASASPRLQRRPEGDGPDHADPDRLPARALCAEPRRGPQSRQGRRGPPTRSTERCTDGLPQSGDLRRPALPARLPMPAETLEARRSFAELDTATRWKVRTRLLRMDRICRPGAWAPRSASRRDRRSAVGLREQLDGRPSTCRLGQIGVALCAGPRHDGRLEAHRADTVGEKIGKPH